MNTKVGFQRESGLNDYKLYCISNGGMKQISDFIHLGRIFTKDGEMDEETLRCANADGN